MYQTNYILIGALFALITTALSSFVLPYFSIFLFAGIDSIGFLFFLALITYSIKTHGLFSIKILLIELVTFCLWFFILIRIMLSQTISQALIESGVFLTVFVLGVLLIQSVHQGLKQRKEIEDLTTNLEQIYTDLRTKV